MREVVAAHFANAPAPQAPARNASPRTRPPSLDTYNSHRKIRRPRLIGDKKVYRPHRRNTLARIDETPTQTLRPRSKSLQHSSDFYSTRPLVHSISHISADTSQSVPVCDVSQESEIPAASNSPQYAEPKSDSSSVGNRPASMTDLPLAVPVDPVTGAYIPHPAYSYYLDDGCRLSQLRKYNKKIKKMSSKHNNLYLAFMY